MTTDVLELVRPGSVERTQTNGGTNVDGRYLVPIVLSAIALTAIVSCMSVLLAETFLRHHSYFFDAASYSYRNALLYTRVEMNGTIAAAWQELLTNNRYPIRTVPLALLAPSVLAHPMGHVTTAIPSLLAFLVVFGIAVRRRSGSTLFSIVAMALFCSLTGIYNPNYGFATYWLDFVAALWAGAAAMCLINSDETRSTKWIIAFAVFASFAALSRYIAAGYVLFSCLPILVIYSIKRIGHGEELKKVATPYLWLFLTIALLAGAFLVCNAHANLQFYSNCCYSLGQKLRVSFFDETLATRWFFTDQLLCELSILCALQLIVGRKLMRNWQETLIPLWLGVSTHVLMVLVLRANGGGPQTYYCVPLVLFAFVSPLAICAKARLPHARLFALTMVVLAISMFVHTYENFSQSASHPSDDARDRKVLDVQVAELIAKENSSLVWNEYFDERAWLPTMEAFYKNHKLCMPAGQTYFTIHESGWTSAYPGLSPMQIAEKVKKASNKLVGFAVVFDDPNQAWKSDLNNVYSKTVASEFAKEVKHNAQWRRVAVFESKVFGKLAAYVNTKADPKAFANFLEGRNYHPGTM